jgi:Acetyltransferase (GNAT) domain
MHASAPNIQLSTRVLRLRSEVEELKTLWTKLDVVRDADPDFFLFFVELYSDAICPHVIVIYENDTPKALLLGRLEEKPITFSLAHLKYRTSKVRVLTFIHGGIVGNLTEQYGKCILNSICSSLNAGEAQAACFESINVNESLFANEFLKLHPFPGRILNQTIHYSRRLEGGQFLQSLSSNERNNHKRRTRKILDTYENEVNIVCFRDPDKVSVLMQDAELVASKSYQRGLHVGYHNTDQIRETLVFQAKLGWLRGYVLYIKGRPSAFWIGSFYRGTFFSDYLAFDSTYEKVAPGAYLTFEALKDLVEVGATNVDFGGGEAEYKARLSNQSCMEAKIWFFAAGFQGQRLRLIWTTAVATNFLAKKILRWTKLGPRLKRHLHRRVRPHGQT